MTKLDDILMSLIAAVPDWRQALAPEEVELVQARLDGLTLCELAARTGLTKAGVRFRLYGTGHGGCRQGGAIGKLRGCQRMRLLEQRHSAHAVGG